MCVCMQCMCVVRTILYCYFMMYDINNSVFLVIHSTSTFTINTILTCAHNTHVYHILLLTFNPSHNLTRPPSMNKQTILSFTRRQFISVDQHLKFILLAWSSVVFIVQNQHKRCIYSPYIFTFIVMVTAKIITNISTLIDEAHTISINPSPNGIVNASPIVVAIHVPFSIGKKNLKKKSFLQIIRNVKVFLLENF